MERSWESKEAILLVGLKARTTNAAELKGGADAKIGPTVGRFMSDQWPQNIQDQVESGVMYSVYTEFESDENGPYTYFIGVAVSSFEHVPEGLSTLEIPAQRYCKWAVGPGPTPEACVEAWQAIWQMNEEDFGGKRRYLADFERYDQRAANPNDACFDIYLGLCED